MTLPQHLVDKATHMMPMSIFLMLGGAMSSDISL